LAEKPPTVYMQTFNGQHKMGEKTSKKGGKKKGFLVYDLNPQISRQRFFKNPRI